MNVSSQTLLQWRQDGKQEVEHGNNGFEVLCGTISVHFLSYVSWIERGHHVEGKGKETASLHSSMPIFIEQKKKSPCVRSNQRGQSGRNPEGFTTSSQLMHHLSLGAWTVSMVHNLQ